MTPSGHMIIPLYHFLLSLAIRCWRASRSCSNFATHQARSHDKRVPKRRWMERL